MLTNDPFEFVRRRIAKIVADELAFTPNDLLGARRRALGRVTDDQAWRGVVGMAMLEAEVDRQLRARRSAIPDPGDAA